MALSRSSKAFLGVLVFLAAVGGGVVFYLLTTSPTSQFAEGQTVMIEVPEGAGAGTVGDMLEERGIIRSAAAFRLAARFDERSGQIRPGIYQLTAGMSTDEILALLSEAPPPAETFRVTIPEGLTVEQTLERIAERSEGRLTADELRSALDGITVPDWVPSDLPEGAERFEGLLFPDTYEFLASIDAHELLAKLVQQTEFVMGEITPPEGRSLYEVLIIASLVEREARVREEQPQISSVIHNRLAQPMRLQVDATVIYALGEHTDRVTFDDLEIDSPWNTYRNDGLPPTPISGAGRGAVMAAAEPADTDYLFYVVKDLETGAHAFAETQAEHNQNVAEFRRMRDEAAAQQSQDG